MDSDYLDLALHDDMNLDHDSPFPLLLKPMVHGGFIPNPAFGVAVQSSQQVLVQDQSNDNRASSQHPESIIQMQLDAIDRDQDTWKCFCSFAKHGTAHGVTWSRILIEHQGEFAQLYERFPELDSTKVKSNDLKQILALMLNLNNPDELLVVGPYPRKEEAGFHAYLQLLPQHYVSFYSYMHHVCLLGVLFHGIVALMDVRGSMPDWVRSNIKDFGFHPPPECPPDDLDFLIHGESPTLEYKFTCVNLMDKYRSTLRQLEPFSIDLKYLSDGINDIGVSTSLALLGVSQPHLEYIRPIGPVPTLWEVRATTCHVHCVGHGFRATEARHAALIHLLILAIRGAEPSAFNDLAAGRGTMAIIKSVNETLGEIGIQRRSQNKNIEMDGFSYVMPPTIQSTISSNGAPQHSSTSPPTDLISTFHIGHQPIALSSELCQNPDVDRHHMPNAGSPHCLRSRSPYRALAVHQQQTPLYYSHHPYSNERNIDSDRQAIQPHSLHTARHYLHAGAGVYDDQMHIDYVHDHTHQQSPPSDRFDLCSHQQPPVDQSAGLSEPRPSRSRYAEMDGFTTANLRHNISSRVNKLSISKPPRSGFDDSGGINSASLRHNISSGTFDRSTSRPACSENYDSGDISAASLQLDSHSGMVNNPPDGQHGCSDSKGITTASLRHTIQTSSRLPCSEYNKSEGLTTASLRQDTYSGMTNNPPVSRQGQSGCSDSEGITTASLRHNIRSSSRLSRLDYKENEGLSTASLRYNNDSEIVNRLSSKPAQTEFDATGAMSATSSQPANHSVMNDPPVSRYVVSMIDETDDYSFNSYHRNNSNMINPSFARHEHSGVESASAGNLRHKDQYCFADQSVRPIPPGHPEFDRVCTYGMQHNDASSISNSDGFGSQLNTARHSDDISAGKYPQVPPYAMPPPHLSRKGTNEYENMFPIRSRPRPIELMRPVAYSDIELNGRYDHHAGAWPVNNEHRNRFENVDSDIAITDLQNDINNLRTYVQRQKSRFIHREQMYLRNQLSLQAQIDYNDAALQSIMLNSPSNSQIITPISKSPFYTPTNPDQYIKSRSICNEAYPTARYYSRPSARIENRINGHELYGMYDRPNR